MLSEVTRVTKYKQLHRSVLSETVGLPPVGVYVLAYMGRVVYVGRASISVADRLSNHVYTCDDVGSWMRKVQGDWDNVRLDVLEIPDDCDSGWLDTVEMALIDRFRPLFNTVGNVR